MITTLMNLDNAIRQAIGEGDRQRANYLSMMYFRLKYDGRDLTTDRKPQVNKDLVECGLKLTPTFKDEDGVQFYEVKVAKHNG